MDMLVLSDDNFSFGSIWLDELNSRIEAASRDGFVLLLITESSQNSHWVTEEMRRAIKAGGKIIPVYIGNATLSGELLEHLGDIMGAKLSSEPTDEELNILVQRILERVEYYSSDYRSSYGFENAVNITLPAISRLDETTFALCDNLRCVTIPSSVVYIAPNTFASHPNILIKCQKDSYAHHFCQKNNLNHEIIYSRKWLPHSATATFFIKNQKAQKIHSEPLILPLCFATRYDMITLLLQAAPQCIITTGSVSYHNPNPLSTIC